MGARAPVGPAECTRGVSGPRPGDRPGPGEPAQAPGVPPQIRLMITAAANDISAMIANMPPSERREHRWPVTALAAGAHDRRHRQHGDRGEHQPADREARRHERHLQLVAHETDQSRNPMPTGERDQERHPDGRDADGPEVGAVGAAAGRVPARDLRAGVGLVAAHRGERSRRPRSGLRDGLRGLRADGGRWRRSRPGAAASARLRRRRRAPRRPRRGTPGPPRPRRTSRSSARRGP